MRNVRIKVKDLLVPEQEQFNKVWKNEEKCLGRFRIEDLEGVWLYKVLNEDNALVGYFGLCKYEYDTLDVCYLYVYEKYRKKGYASAILSYIREKYRTKEKYIYLHCKENNFNALNFYVKRYEVLCSDRRTTLKMQDEFDLKILAFKNHENCYEFVLWKASSFGK